jgi:hypothetical protein
MRTNYAKDTERNTRKTAEGIQALRQALIPRSGAQFFNPAISGP